MLTLSMPDTKLKDLLDGISSTSRLEEMLSLMIGDRSILEMNIANYQLFKDTNNTGPELVEHWELSREEMAEFFDKVKEAIGAKLKKNIREETILIIHFDDVRVSMTAPPVSDFSFLVRKSPQLYSSTLSSELISMRTREDGTAVSSGREMLIGMLSNTPRSIVVEDTAELSLG